MSFSGVGVAADEIRIEPGDCTSGVRLVARDAPISEILRQLAATLGFELRDEAPNSTRVTLELSREPAQLVAKLLANQPVIVTETRDPNCPKRRRIASLWVLPTGSKPSTAPNAAAPAPVPPRAAPTPRELDEQSRQAKENYDAYIRAHGRPPSGVDEDAAK